LWTCKIKISEVKKTNDLVRLTTQDVAKGFPVTNSLIVAQEFGKNHNTVLRDIRDLEIELKNSFGPEELGLYKIVQSSYINSQNKEQPMVQMNRDFFIMLVMGYRTKEAYKVKHKFIQAFNFMESELKARKETRSIGISVRKDLQASIKNYVTDPESQFKNFAYSNYTRLVYKKVMGKDVKKIKAEKGLNEKDNLRDHLNMEELKKVQDLESKIATYIEFTDQTGKTDKEIFAEIKKVLES